MQRNGTTLVATFPSSRDATVIYTTAVFESGNAECDCPSRHECWHVRFAKGEAARTQADPFIAREIAAQRARPRTERVEEF